MVFQVMEMVGLRLDYLSAFQAEVNMVSISIIVEEVFAQF